MWPIASRVLGGKYGKVTKLKNGILMKTDLKDILGRFVIFYGPYVDHFWEPKTTQLIEKLLRESSCDWLPPVTDWMESFYSIYLQVFFYSIIPTQII